MRRELIIARLREHEDELRAEGITALSLFGSVARGDEDDSSDIDIAVALAQEIEGLAYFSRMESMRRRLEAILDRPIDLVSEPVRKEQLQRRIDEDRAVAF